jgi:hypothetical protein
MASRGRITEAEGGGLVVSFVPNGPRVSQPQLRRVVRQASGDLVPPLVLQEDRKWTEGTGLAYDERMRAWLYNGHIVLTDEEMYNIQEEGTDMKRSEILKKAMEDAVVQEALEGMFNDLPNDAVISWNGNWHGHNASPQYTFVALKAAGYWYTTVMSQRYRLTTAQLLDQSWFKARTTDVWLVSSWETFLEED